MIPRTLEEVEPRWLEQVLGLPAGAIGSIMPVAPKGGIAVTSRVSRLVLEPASSVEVPPSVFIKLLRESWSNTALHAREVRFYRELAPLAPLPIPRCYQAEFDEAAGAFVLILEDLAEAQPGLLLQGMGLPEAEVALEAMAKVHGGWWQSEELLSRSWPRKAPDREAAGRILARFEEVWPRLLAATDGRYPVPDYLEDTLMSATDRFVEGLSRLGEAPGTLIHSDLHTENFLFDSNDGPLRFIAFDWQNASLGHCAFDVASLIGFSTRPEVQVAHSEELLQRYHTTLIEAGGAGSLEALRQDVATALLFYFFGVAAWLTDFEAESERDIDTIQGHWRRLATGLWELVGAI